MGAIRMFEKGEYIVCHNIGVCLVENVTKQDINQVNEDELYYVLQPMDSKDSKIYSAVNNEKMAMRKVIPYEEVHKLMEQLGNIMPIEIIDEKKREEVYKDALYQCECIEWARLIKTIYYRKEEKAKKASCIL